MEALSDFFAEMVEYYYYGHCDWLYDGGVRNLVNPSLSTEGNTPHPSTYKGENWYGGSKDYGGVHYNSTVISHAAYLMSENGGGSINMEDLSILWYRAMLMMPSDCNFNDCRQLVELAATSMELTTAQINCVSEAFAAVGITGYSDEDDSDATYKVGLNGNLKVYGGDGELCSNYTLVMSQKKLINLGSGGVRITRYITSAEPYNLDGLSKGKYTFTITDNANANNSVTFAVSVNKKYDSSSVEVFTNFGCTPVKGTVSEIKKDNGVETNIPISNAVISVYSHSEETVVETINIAETEGFFEVYLPTGSYSFVTEAEGYVSTTVSFDVGFEDIFLPIILESENGTETYVGFASVIEDVQNRIDYNSYSDSQKEYCRGDFFDVDGKDALVLMYHVLNSTDLTPGYYVGLWVENSNGTISCLTDQLIEEVGNPGSAYVTVNIRKIDGKMYLNPCVRQQYNQTDIWKNQYYLIGDELVLEYGLYSEAPFVSMGDGLIQHDDSKSVYYLNQELTDRSTFYSTQNTLNSGTYILGLDPNPNWSEGLPPQGYTFEELLSQLPAGTTSNDSNTNNSLTELGLSADSAQAIVDVYVPFCQSLSDTYTSSDGSVAKQRSCLVVEFETGIPNLVVHYWVPNAYSPGQFCEAWIIYGIENGEVVELYSDENYAPTRREIHMVYEDTYGFALREEQTISGANYCELIIHYPNNVTDVSIYESYSYIQQPEDSYALRVWTISGEYMDISF